MIRKVAGVYILILEDMADNYLEKKMEELQARKAKEARAKQLAWKKRMDAYRKRLAEEAKKND